MIHASESQHWYKRDGSPCYTVKSRHGSDRPTTLRDARKLGLVPSVTSIIKCAAAPALQRWKTEQMMMSALTLPRDDTEPEKEWIARVWTDSGETARKAAERGTAIHAAIQGYYEGKYPDPALAGHALSAVEKLRAWIDVPVDHVWVPEESFACELGFGGKVDLHCGGFVADVKTKEFGEAEDLKTRDEHAMQLAAYRHGLGMPEARCAICYVSVTAPGLAKLIEIPEKELKRGWFMFRALLDYWQYKNDFVSAWERKEAA